MWPRKRKKKRSRWNFDRIVLDESQRGNKPVVRGTRISVAIILEWIASGITRADIIRKHPHLEHEDLTQALDFAASNVAIRIPPLSLPSG